MSVSHLVTHSGGFHADELLCSVVLTRLFPDASLIRSRDEVWTKPAPDRIIYDVGHTYDAQMQVFDHHQRPIPLRADGQPYSSFGLIWHHFGRDYLRALSVPKEHVDSIHSSIDHSFVLPIDLADNGVLEPSEAGLLAGLTLPILLESLKPVFDERAPDADDRAFFDALPLARSFLEAAIKGSAAKARAETIVAASIEAAGTSEILELPMGMPFRGAIEKMKADHLLFVIHPRDADWALTTIRTSGDSFTNRADLPLSWAGLTDADLERACGVPGAKFCHNARFIAVAATRDAALAMAEIAVAESSQGAVARQGNFKARGKSMRIPEMVSTGLLPIGTPLTIKNRQDSEAIVIDGGHVSFRGQVMTFIEWGCAVTGWRGIQIYKWARLPDGRLLEELRVY